MDRGAFVDIEWRCQQLAFRSLGVFVAAGKNLHQPLPYHDGCDETNLVAIVRIFRLRLCGVGRECDVGRSKHRLIILTECHKTCHSCICIG